MCRDPSPDTLKAVHANYYPDGAGVGRHSDKDGPFDHSKPIYSYTFLSDASRPRDFLIHDARIKRAEKKRAREEDKPYAVFTLEHGTLLIMGGKNRFTISIQQTIKPIRYTGDNHEKKAKKKKCQTWPMTSNVVPYCAVRVLPKHVVRRFPSALLTVTIADDASYNILLSAETLILPNLAHSDRDVT
jgi:hypothetical protein